MREYEIDGDKGVLGVGKVADVKEICLYLAKDNARYILAKFDGPEQAELFERWMDLLAKQTNEVVRTLIEAAGLSADGLDDDETE